MTIMTTKEKNSLQANCVETAKGKDQNTLPSPAMDLLCSIPPPPRYVLVRDLCVEFDLTHKEICELVREIHESYKIKVYFCVKVHKRKTWKALTINKPDWSLVKLLCDKYWQRVYG